MRVLDTVALPPSERPEAYMSTISTRDVPYRITHDSSAGPFAASVDYWALDSGVDLMQSSDTGMRMTRGDQELKVSAPERMAIAIKVTGTGTITQRRYHQALNPGDMFIIDQTAPNDYAATSAGLSSTILIDYQVLGIGVELVRNASMVLPHSPMYRMFRAHMAELFRVVNRLDYDEMTWSTLTASSVALAQVLVTTAAGDRRAAADALRTSQVPRMDLYVKRHLRDRDLTAAKIAQANHMSTRHLYSIWAARDVSLAEHIMANRLQGASQDLLKENLRSRSVTEIASSWGFVSAAHFSRRFKASFGVNPLQWRQMNNLQRDMKA